METFTDRIAVVTGGASGIGRALAQALAREGAHILIADVDEPGMAETARLVTGLGRKAVTAVVDVRRRAEVERLAERAFAEFGGAHVVCNNAGVVVHGGLETATPADWEWLIGVNLWGVIHGVDAFVPRMIAQRAGGHVVNTASMAGLIATQGLGIYNTTKYAVVGLSETLQKDLRGYGIGVSVLCPMGVATEIRRAERNRPPELRDPAPAPASHGEVVLIGRTLAPEDVARQVVAAIRANRLYIITHEEGLEPLRRRFQRMEQAVKESR
ncbi:MAG: SDR family NAD(P)-dependent oxidoreductase [Candidatus Rokubacteria bacterium]|nr:SDR family NAD(P)-dependent oxidoreductase [Candidatus Rokubacteria bacterium]